MSRRKTKIWSNGSYINITDESRLSTFYAYRYYSNNTYELMSYKARSATRFTLSNYLISMNAIKTIYVTGSFKRQEQAFIALMEWVHKNIKDGK